MTETQLFAVRSGNGFVLNPNTLEMVSSNPTGTHGDAAVLTKERAEQVIYRLAEQGIDSTLVAIRRFKPSGEQPSRV